MLDVACIEMMLRMLQWIQVGLSYWVWENSGGYKRQEDKSPAFRARKGLYSFKEMAFSLKMPHPLIKRVCWYVSFVQCVVST